MPGSKTAKPALPLALAMYIATSALRTTSSAVSVSSRALAMPMLAVTLTCVVADDVRHPQLAGQPLGHGQRALEVGRVVGEDRELVAAQAGDEVAGADRVGDPLGDGLEERVAGGVAERVVDDLEVVEVDEQDGA